MEALAGRCVVTSEDPLPKHVCEACAMKLDDSYRLRMQAQETDNALRERLGLIKIEYQSETKYDISCWAQAEFDSAVCGDELKSDSPRSKEEYKPNDTEYFSADSLKIKVEPDTEIFIPKTSHKTKRKKLKDYKLTYKDVANKLRYKTTSNAKRKHKKENIAKELTIDNQELNFDDIKLKIENSNDELPIYGPLWIEVQDDKSDIIKINGDRTRVENGRVFVKKENILRKKKREMKKINECTLCNRVFKHRHSYDRHMRVEHKMDGFARAKDCMCDVCGRTFHDQYGLRMHKRSHSGDRPFTCNVCGQGFTQQSNMERHVSARHNKDKPFQCELCSKRFAYASTLREHTRAHLGEQNHVCTICSRRFSRRFALARHQLTHTHARPYACKHCGRTYTQTNDLKAHVKRTHAEAPTEKLLDYCVKQVIP